MKGESPRTHRIKLRDPQGRVVGEKEVVSFRGLLEMVHKERLRECSTELVQAPSKDNGDTAIVRAVVRTTRGTFSGIGDANPRNVSAHIVPHIIRMAETRALARAMRVATGCGETALEELDGTFDEVADERPFSKHEGPGRRTNEHQPEPATGPNGADRASAFDHHRAPARGMGERFGSMRADGQGQQYGSSGRASDSQRRFLYRLLAQTGRTGEVARAFIHETLGVDNLEQAPRHAVSALIDSLKSEVDQGGGSSQANGASRGHGSSNGNGSYHEPGHAE